MIEHIRAHRSLRERSKAYVSWGWPLVPIAPRGKEPHEELLRDIYRDTRLKHLRNAPAFPEEVEYWFENDPEINLAVIPCSSASVVVVDVDALDVHDLDVLTPTVCSGRVGGGKHFYFSSRRELPPQKAWWGDLNPPYVLLPGSIHPSGAVYEWLPGRSPEDVPFMPFEQVTHRFDISLEPIDV